MAVSSEQQCKDQEELEELANILDDFEENDSFEIELEQVMDNVSHFLCFFYI